MRGVVLAMPVLTVLYAADRAAEAQTSCKVCGEQHKACMKNYAGPACKTEYQMCLKSCKSKQRGQT
jgi:hypothetical protein